MLFNILPTLLEIGLVAAILISRYDIWFSVIIFVTLAAYIALTLIVTEWRMIFRRTMNDMDSKANTQAIDSLLNYETVKYFGNESWEARRYDEHMQKWETAAVRNQTSLAALNSGQSAIIAIGVTLLLWLAADGVIKGTHVAGRPGAGQCFHAATLYAFAFSGFVYREIKHSLADMEKMFSLLAEHEEIKDKPGATDLIPGNAAVRFEEVNFSYEPNRQILFDVSFDIPAGRNCSSGRT